LIDKLLQNLSELPDNFEEKVKTDFYPKLNEYFQEQLKTNERANTAWQSNYLVSINNNLLTLINQRGEPRQITSREDKLQEDKLHEVLLRLNYSKQVRVFQDFVYNHQIGACLIHGKEKTGQRWLLNRLIQEVPNENTSTLVRKISFSSNTRKNSLDSILKEINRRIGMPLESSIEKTTQNIVDLWQSQTVIFTFYNPDCLGDGRYLEEFLEYFWQPLVTKAETKGTTDNNYQLLLFFVDYSGHTNSWNIDCLEEITPQWIPQTLIKFKDIEPLNARELSIWLEREVHPANLLEFTSTLAAEGVTTHLKLRGSKYLAEL